MLSLGLRLGREHLAAALQRRMVLAAIVFAVVVPVPALAVAFVKLLGLKGAVAGGIVLMSISPGAPVALRRALDVGGRTGFAPVLHLAIVMLAVVTVPASVIVIDLVFGVTLSISPLDVARQVFITQLLPLGIGVALHIRWPAVAARLQEPLTRVSNVMLLALHAVCLYTLWPLLVDVGWIPGIGGAVLTACALAIGAAFAGRDAAARPPAAIAAAMRNPGLALMIATVNHLPIAVTAAVFGYALGAAVVVTAFVVWRTAKRPPETGS